VNATPRNDEALEDAIRDAILEAVAHHGMPIDAGQAARLVAAVTTAVHRHAVAPVPRKRKSQAPPSDVRGAKRKSSMLGPIPHGTPQGYRRELYRGLVTCDDCRAAYNADQAFRRANPVGPRPPRAGFDQDVMAALFATNTHREGEHLLWTGPAMLRAQHQRFTPFQASWAATRSRPPQGHIKRTCERDGCVEPQHLADRKDREFEDAVLGAGDAP